MSRSILTFSWLVRLFCQLWLVGGASTELTFKMLEEVYTHSKFSFTWKPRPAFFPYRILLFDVRLFP
jgi:hypothetical protein